MLVVVTGAAGFIGSHVAHRLLEMGHEVAGVDDLNAYYAPALKQARLAQLDGRAGFTFHKRDLADPEALAALNISERVECVIHLAAQAGVRHSLK
ncbi:MAG: GDP-mannose 4,6-dehydratase, partial [Caulobacterales bacterium]|nr:GDP-mannose 4,6-dehydratase [Caulobacterales bacterium]